MSLEYARKDSIHVKPTSGTFSLSVWDEAASVVTARFDRDLTTLLLKGRALTGLKTRVNIVSLVIAGVQMKSGELKEALQC